MRSNLFLSEVERLSAQKTILSALTGVCDGMLQRGWIVQCAIPNGTALGVKGIPTG
jgi:hypothetical protein